MEFGQNKIKQLKRSLSRDANDYSANLQMGLFYLKKEDIPSALPYLEKASAVRPENTELSFVIANAFKSLGKRDRSESYFNKALEKDPDNYEYLYNYGLLLQSMGKQGRAIEILKKAVSFRPDNFELLNDLGVLCFQRQDHEHALQYFNQAIAISPGYVLALINMGYAYLSLGDLNNAKKILEKIEARAPYDPEYLELRAQFQGKLDESSGSRAEIQTDLTFSDQLFEITPLQIIKNFGEKRLPEDVGLSLVIPVHNEVENIPILYRELKEVLGELKENYEIVFINDGSTDGSPQTLDRIAEQDSCVRVIHFRRNYGQTAAMNAGFKLSQGSVVITLDADLQNDPADIPKLLEKMAQGYDLVSGWRKDRKDTLITRKIPSMAANRLINKLIEGTGVQLHDFGCTLKAYKRGIIKNIDLYGEMHRFIPVFAAWLGVKVTEIPVNHRPRIHGYAKYNLSRVSRVIFDLVVVRFFSDYMTRPIQFFGKIAKKLVLAGLAGILLLVLLSTLTPFDLSAVNVIILGALLLFAALQFISMGLLGELMMRSYFEIQKKDSFVVEKITSSKAS
jgi:glycosyltransferase involved in cell wall biosynthesis/Tfp pilus assembly protein PilF